MLLAPTARAALELGLLLQMLGRTAEADGWLDAVVRSTRGRSVADRVRVGRAAHALGIRTNCTMLYGHVETPADRIRHLIKLREHQAESLASRPAHLMA